MDGEASPAPVAGVPEASEALLAQPLGIGSLTVPARLFMAPMAGLTTPALRRSVRRFGAAVVFTEMISAAGLHYRTPRTREYLSLAPDEHPVGCQLFGTDAELLAEAAVACVEAGADLIDLNMACPVRKVVRTGAGAALLDDPRRAVAIVAATVSAVEDRVPVTVKLRSGVRTGETTVLDLGPRLAGAGAAALCLHPRSASQMYRGSADHSLTRRLAATATVPVLASGDVSGRDVCLGLLEGGAAGVMVARAAIGRPWVFAEILGARLPGPEERLAELAQFVDDVIAERGPRALGHLRQFWPRFRGSGTLTRAEAAELMQATACEQIRSLLQGMTQTG